jgi:uncharacterized RDD family membrane protein YckC
VDDSNSNNRFAPPRAEVADVPPDPERPPVLATRSARFGAALIDMLIAVTIYFAVMLPIYGLEQFHIRGDRSQHLAGHVLYYALAYSLEAWFLYQSSQSVGKIALGLRIVRMDSSRASFARTFGLRTVVIGAVVFIPYVGALFALVDCLFIFGSSRRCLHDCLADTIVVTAASSPTPTDA